jgi:hypothetical protein
MSEQTKFEVIKALAYGEEPQQIADAEGIDITAVLEVQQTCAGEIAEEQDDLKKAGYLE